MLQVVFQVVLRELCHHADVIFSVKKEDVWRAKKRASLRLWCPLLVYGFIGLADYPAIAVCHFIRNHHLTLS